MRAEMASNVSGRELQKLLSHADHEGLMHIILGVLASCTEFNSIGCSGAVSKIGSEASQIKKTIRNKNAVIDIKKTQRGCAAHGIMCRSAMLYAWGKA